MNIRPLLLGLPLLLTGCSALSNFSWPSLWPLTGFGSNYRLRGGMATRNGQVVAYYQALSGDKVKLVIIGQPKGRVQQVEIMDQNL